MPERREGEMEPPAANPREMALERLQAFRDDWEDCRDDPALASEKARALLAGWGVLCRLFDPAEPPGEVADVPQLLQESSRRLLDTLQQVPAPADWLERARHLDRAWEHTVRAEDLRELELAAVELFVELDDDSLALCMARRLPGAETASAWLAEWSGQVNQNQSYFAEHTETFLPAAPLAGRWLDASREDLDEADPELWETTLKHRRLEEAAQEAEAGAPPLALNAMDRQALRAWVDTKKAEAATYAVEAAALRSLVVMVAVRGMQIQAYSRRALPPLGLGAAAAPGEMPGRHRTVFTWKKSDGTDEARTLVPAGDVPAAGQEPIRLNIYNSASGEPAYPLAGRIVRLAGIERPLDSRARADFTLQELHDAGQDLLLEVDGEPWSAVP